MALIVANKRLKNFDKAIVQQLEAKLKTERSQCGETALFFGSMFLFHNSRADKAREYVDRMLKMNSSSVQVFFGYYFDIWLLCDYVLLYDWIVVLVKSAIYITYCIIIFYIFLSVFTTRNKPGKIMQIKIEGVFTKRNFFW